MSRACVLLAEGFEEIEAVTVIDVLRRAGVDTTVVGVNSGYVEGAHGITVDVDTTLDKARGTAWDMVILPGGLPGSTNLRDDPQVLDLLRGHYDQGGDLAAICAAPIVLARAGVLKNRRATSYPSFADELGDVEYVERAVVQDGPITTSRGPGTAMQFALHIVERLVGLSRADELRRAMLTE